MRTASTRANASREDEQPLFGASLRALRDVSPRDLGIRFAFGATLSATAGIVATLCGAQVGGILLAFPAILPATLPLIEKKDSKRKAEDDDVGAILGAISLVLFAGFAWRLLPHLGVLALAVAGAAWLACAVTLYLALQFASRRNTP